MTASPFAVVYLHGFASGPSSQKAAFFSELCAARGIPFRAPDLNAPCFADITLSRIVRAAEQAAAELAASGAPERLCVIGSSLGGYAACGWAEEREARGQPLSALMLMAPAFSFHRRFKERMPAPALAAWRESGTLALRDEHGQWIYGPQFPSVAYTLYEDALAWDARPLLFSAPTLIFHGDRDEQVPISGSKAFAAARPNTKVEVIPGAPHALLDELPAMAKATFAWFEKFSQAR